MGTLIGYEVKKIVKKRSTAVAFLIIFALHLVFICIAGNLGSTYVDDEFYETHAERNRIDRENGISLSGRKIDNALLEEMQKAYDKIDWSTNAYMWTDTYKSEVRKYSDLEYLLKAWGLGSELIQKGVGETSAHEMSSKNREEILYQTREAYREAMWEQYGLSKKEVAYWEEKEEEVEIPFTYEYATAYQTMLGMQGIYMICMLGTFFTAISMVNVFMDEHSRKTDQLILCTKHGRGKEYAAKILAGTIVTFVIHIIFVITALVGRFYSYGMEGFDAAIQVITAFGYSYAMSAGEALLVCIGILLLSSVMTAIFTMLLAETLKHSVGAMAVVVGLLFAARLVMLPPSWGILSKLWSYFPINMLKIDEGFLDLRLVNIFGIQLTAWQFAPILYSVLIAGMVWIGSKVYKNYQVCGR
uniref:ABC transporter permease subunit n=1 Tax=Agathobacter sp. TaxID=2021311 RepID=UPI004056778E